MADLKVFNGVPVATYGLTGLLLVFLTGMTFIDTTDKTDETVSAVATASIPAFIGNTLTPTAPPLTESVSELFNNPDTDEKSTAESIAESGMSVVESLKDTGKSTIESLTESGKSAVESIADSSQSIVSNITGNTPKQAVGGKRKNKTRKSKNKIK